ncbi:elongation factor Tu, putative [Plasmodium malariae]|uniref:Elongation factor Tu, putative n=1 Tax=Plasmodium malariae TaxID=5858 RepID=A0A1D3SNW0_PLAMA|nr:elongation factor Tu, putative [Plasmodium malariae]SCO93578.1 elongation factor Tu, putative [Plasmodium malariae]
MDLIKHLNENDKIRNICILAHVDHGKTTLVDNLISSNKIISDKNIGKVKYLDSREDEQKRQITMKSSSILLKHTYSKLYLSEIFNDITDSTKGGNNQCNVKNENYEMHVNHKEFVKNDNNENALKCGKDSINIEKECGDSKENDEESLVRTRNNNYVSDNNHNNSRSSGTHLINIIDTPGHVDFSSEVSTCVRICDGSLILIDCIEGLCSQTKTVLRQTWKEMIKSIIVINKIDKLITNQNMDSISAYEHINNIIEQVNAYIYQLYIEENMNNENIETSELEKYSYSPLKGNVLLCSSIHCWCVDMNIFSILFCKKMNIDLNNSYKIKKYMWNQYYFNMKEKKILKIPNDTNYSCNNMSTKKKKKKNLFSLVVLDFLWKIYDITTINRDDDKIKKLCSELNISDQFLKKNQQNNSENNTFILTYIMSHFLNLSRSIFNACIEMFPSPKSIDESRLFKIFPSLYNEKIYKNIINCSLTNEFTIIYISKYICANIHNNTLVGFKGFYDKNTFLSICRIYSGMLYQNMILYICGKSIKTVVKKIYICMGGDLLPINEAFAGNIVAVYLSIINDGDHSCVHNDTNRINGLKEQEIINMSDHNLCEKFGQHNNGYVGQNERGEEEKVEEVKEVLKEEKEKDVDEVEEEETLFENNNGCSLDNKKKIMNRSGNCTPTNNKTKNTNDQFCINTPLNIGGSCNTEDLQYLSNTLMKLIKNKQNKKEHNIFLMNNDGIFLNKNITLSSQENMDSFILPFSDTSSTILHTIIEPKNIQDMNKFLYGLILLYTCDTSIDIDFNEKGEYILKFCGEIHMQKCLSDFVNIYSNIEIKTSDTNISIREGISDNYIKVKRKKNKIHDNLKDLYNYYLKIHMDSHHKISENNNNYNYNNMNGEIAKDSYKIVAGNENCNIISKEKNSICNNNADDGNYFTKMKKDGLEHLFKNINLEKENHFLNILFNYSHNTICHKLNNNSFYVFLSVLDMPENMLHFFDKHYSNIQTILENRSISPSLLNYSKIDLSCKNEYFMYKQCLINLEKCVNDLCFSDNIDYDNIIENRLSKSIVSSSVKREEGEWDKAEDKEKEKVAERDKEKVKEGKSKIHELNQIINENLTHDSNDEESQHNNNDRNIMNDYNSTENTKRDSNYHNNEKISSLRKNKNFQLELWDICVQNGSITLLYIKKYFNKKKNNEYILDNILTNEKYKNIINQRSFVDTYLSDTNSDINIYLNNISLGFKLASKYGPIAQEPIRGALFVIEGLIIDEASNDEPFEDGNSKDNLEDKINAGNIIALMKEACLNSMQQNKLRIFEPMLRLNLTCESNVLGKVYNVLLKRRCSILSEEIKDGYFLYCIDAYLPLFNSFKLAEELRSKCSGNVIYDIQFSHWNKLNEDIFLLNDSSSVIYDEDFDIKLTDNTATEIVNYIRRAKGLETNEKIIQKPEKQCTLKK